MERFAFSITINTMPWKGCGLELYGRGGVKGSIICCRVEDEVVFPTIGQAWSAWWLF